MIVQLFRFVFFTAGALAGIAVSGSVDLSQQIGTPYPLGIVIFVILGGSIGYLIGGIVGREADSFYTQVESRLRELGLADIGLLALGLGFGFLAAFLLSHPIRLLLKPGTLTVLVLTLVYVLSGWAGARIAMIKRGDLPRILLSPGREAEGVQKFLDTSAVIDGRFPDLKRAGFLEGPLRVPRFVLVELQTLADSPDDVKRSRGRRGLDLLASLRSGEASVEVFEADYPSSAAVDEKLMALAKDTGGAIVTTDSNLTRVARVRGMRILNVNELAAAVRPAFLPGESLRVSVVREGKEADQGVGYLQDGTMVVVQGGGTHIGADVDSEVTSVLQTNAGRMIFTRLKAG